MPSTEIMPGRGPAYNRRVRDSSIRIGTAGWSYPSGPGAWTGIVYPARKGRPKDFDELRSYAEHFDTVEVNSTFYRIPTIETTRSWVERTPSGFEFSVKLFQKLTHPRMFLDRLTKPPKGAPKEMVAEKSTLPHDQALAVAGVSSADVDEFRRAIDPLARAGKLGRDPGAVPGVVQARPGRRRPPRLADEVAARLPGRRRAAPQDVERRRQDDAAGPERVARGLGPDRRAEVPPVDRAELPAQRRGLLLPPPPRPQRQGVVEPRALADRYDYLYSAQELDPFVEIAQAVKVLVKKMYLYTNNHFEGKAAANAVMLRDKLGLPNPGGYPPAFVEHYPP